MKKLLLILISLLMIAGCDKSNSHASEARTVISNINNASKMYYMNEGEWPTEIDELERSGQLDVSRLTKLKWTFDIQLSDQGGKIIATSTQEMPGGAGHQVVYDPHIGMFSGYGTTPPKEKKKKRKGKRVNLLLTLKEILPHLKQKD